MDPHNPWYGLSRWLSGEESACNAGDMGLIPRFQMVKNQPAMRETWVLSLGWDDPLEDGMATHSSILAWRIPMDREA